MNESNILSKLAETLEIRKQADPQSSYVAGLYWEGTEVILKKIGVRATELVVAGKDKLSDRIIPETVNLWFHTLLLAQHKQHPEAVLSELQRRFGMSGLKEKMSRTQVA